ncbi:MAG: oxygenase MpaB family protein [Chloroflexi bacterium]|nr:oxygenase MpaB family protein [Chloroflexota bacterium]
MAVPSIYIPGYQRARAANPAMADLYLKHVLIGDPMADAVAASLSDLDPVQSRSFIEAGMDQQYHAMREAPQALRDFFQEISTPPDWYRSDRVLPGRKLFHRYSDLFMPAFFVVTLLNATTLISKGFYTTGRVLGGHAPQRIRENTRHFIEIMLPGSLDRQGDGWKASVRIRLMHAHVRRLIRESGHWDESAYGTPLSSAHMGLASSNFSATMLRHAELLGARMPPEERAGFMQIWRYVSLLIGTPEELLFEGNEVDTREFNRTAMMCEPPPSEESVAVAGSLVHGLPDIAGATDPKAARRFSRNIYRVARALLGHETADRLQFPRMYTLGLLPAMRLHRMIFGPSGQLVPEKSYSRFGNNFAFLLEVSRSLDLNYSLPERLHAE